jgi:hypothetical protein
MQATALDTGSTVYFKQAHVPSADDMGSNTQIHQASSRYNEKRGGILELDAFTWRWTTSVCIFSSIESDSVGSFHRLISEALV